MGKRKHATVAVAPAQVSASATVTTKSVPAIGTQKVTDKPSTKVVVTSKVKGAIAKGNDKPKQPTKIDDRKKTTKDDEQGSVEEYDGDEEEEEEEEGSSSEEEDREDDSHGESSSELEYESDEGRMFNDERWSQIFEGKFNQNEDEDSDDSAHPDEAESEAEPSTADKADSEVIKPLFDTGADSGNESSGKKKKNAKKEARKRAAKDQVRNKLAPTKAVVANKANIEQDEYAHDSSDEEDLKNTIGNIPINMYDQFDHVGYDLDAKKIAKPAKDDEIDNFLNRMDDPNYYRTVYDATTGEKIVLTDDDLAILSRIRKGKYPDPNFDPYKPFIDFFSHETELHPVTNHPLSKAHFTPSLAEKKLINKLVMKIRRARRSGVTVKKDQGRSLQFNFDLWSSEHEPNKWYKRIIPPKKPELPGHIESYNPPPEYLFTEEEKEKWAAQEPEERRLNFVPQKYEALRKVPQYENYVKERFERCLELYLVPRSRRQKANFRPEDLLPNLPRPSELRPYPTGEALCYQGHEQRVNSISFEPSGQLFASGSVDGTVRVWEVLSGRCMRTIELGEEVRCVTWCPNKSLLLAACEQTVFLINPCIANKSVCEEVDRLFDLENGPPLPEATRETPVEWKLVTAESDANAWNKGIRVIITHKYSIKQVTWHHKGDYFASVMPNGKHKSVVIHQLSKRQSQVPFKKSKGLVQKVLFHPTKPYFFVATQRYVRVYNLVKQELSKKLLCTCRYISSIAVHPKGDNVIVGSFDNKLSWFDLDMSGKPYKNLKYHSDSIRQVAYHPSYPLFASASNDGKVVVAHGKVYE
jgi:ribosome biogenesis protein ERB1